MSYFALVVDDDLPSREIYGGMLANLGFDVEIAVDGQQAIDLLSRSQPDLVLLDLLLPRVNGVRVLEYIYATPHLNATRVIIITAHTNYRDSLPLREGDFYFTKPVTPSEIREVILHALQDDPS
jgi:CheY-like chemotaxis protein